MSDINNFNTRKVKHANFIRQAEEEIARGNVVNTTTNAAAFHAAQSAAAAALGRTPVAELNVPSEFSSNNEEEPQAAPNGLRKRVIVAQAVANRRLPPRPRHKRSKCCKGSLCTLQGGQRRRKTKRRRNY